MKTFTYAGKQITVEQFLRQLPLDIGHHMNDGGQMLAHYCTTAANLLAEPRLPDGCCSCRHHRLYHTSLGQCLIEGCACKEFDEAGQL